MLCYSNGTDKKLSTLTNKMNVLRIYDHFTSADENTS